MKDFLIDNKNIYNMQYMFIIYFNFFVKVCLMLYIIGAINADTTYLIRVNFFVKMLIGLFLIYRFNSWRKTTIRFTELDREITFSAGLYILIISFSDYATNLTQKSRLMISKHLHTFTNQISLIKNYTLQFIQIPDSLQKTIT